MAADSSSQAEQQQFYVTKASQQSKEPKDRKLSYTGTRDLTDLQKIQELDIVDEDGSIRGIRNRVRAGQAHFDNPTAITKKKEEEGKVIVYVTSFRGVRSVNEDCRFILTVLHNFRVSVEERDVYLHKYYYHELYERLQLEETSKLPIPQVFISGQLIGGAQEVETLNETGELRRVLADIPRTKVTSTCSTCGGYKFVPCRKCGGSKNSVKNNFTFEFKALKCTGCNENGLEACPDCENKQEETEDEKQHKEKLKEFEKKQRLKKAMAEAERLQKIEADKLAQEKARKKEEKERKAREKRERKEKARKMKEKQAQVDAARQKVLASINEEIEREKAWRREHGLVDEEEEAEKQDSSSQDGSDQDSSNQDSNDQDASDQDEDNIDGAQYTVNQDEDYQDNEEQDSHKTDANEDKVENTDTETVTAAQDSGTIDETQQA